MSTIIFLNGCSSSGKTTIAKAIQYLANAPWLLWGIDTFFQSMPPPYVGFGEKANEGFQFVADQDEHGPIMCIHSGPLGEAIVKSIPKVVKTLADDGLNIIVDEVLFEDTCLKYYVRALSNHTVYFIGILCDLNAMEEREILRGDRALGLARAQVARVHGPTRSYDLTVDSTHISAFDNARNILEFVSQNGNPQGFDKLRKTL
ncbi:MAG: hypothetical protein H0X26_08365 [Alphaproteobacteria bacterium]|nr:hypothetical protein [Alphaproteobacteria bacterium]